MENQSEYWVCLSPTYLNTSRKRQMRRTYLKARNRTNPIIHQKKNRITLIIIITIIITMTNLQMCLRRRTRIWSFTDISGRTNQY